MLQRESYRKILCGSAMSNQFQTRRLTLKILPVVTLGALGFCASTMAATSGPLVGAGGFPVLMKEIVVTGPKQPTAAEKKLNDEVKTARKSDRYFYDYHVAVETRNGVSTLGGLVLDAWVVVGAISIRK